MTSKMTGPETITIAHARLLYQEFDSHASAWSSFIKTIVSIDQIVESHPRIEKANENCYLTFFEAAPKCWIGREIIGHQASWPTPFKAFDSYRGEAFEWSLEQGQSIEGVEQLIGSAKSLMTLAGESLAKTWRVKIGPMESLDLDDDNAVGKMPNISFQFFKSH